MGKGFEYGSVQPAASPRHGASRNQDRAAVLCGGRKTRPAVCSNDRPRLPAARARTHRRWSKPLTRISRSTWPALRATSQPRKVQRSWYPDTGIKSGLIRNLANDGPDELRYQVTSVGVGPEQAMWVGRRHSAALPRRPRPVRVRSAGLEDRPRGVRSPSGATTPATGLWYFATEPISDPVRPGLTAFPESFKPATSGLFAFSKEPTRDHLHG
jgi:hypothetical protein